MKTEQTILENNKLIALYMVKFMPTKDFCVNSQSSFTDLWDVYVNNETLAYESIELHFNNNWNWLMPVVAKISKEIGYKMITECDDIEWQVTTNLTRLSITSSILTVYNAVINYIKWYNTSQ